MSMIQIFRRSRIYKSLHWLYNKAWHSLNSVHMHSCMQLGFLSSPVDWKLFAVKIFCHLTVPQCMGGIRNVKMRVLAYLSWTSGNNLCNFGKYFISISIQTAKIRNCSIYILYAAMYEYSLKLPSITKLRLFKHTDVRVDHTLQWKIVECSQEGYQCRWGFHFCHDHKQQSPSSCMILCPPCCDGRILGEWWSWESPTHQLPLHCSQTATDLKTQKYRNNTVAVVSMF